ncbi:protein ZINC INDUCED FACILITATOR-LIKE [Trifolium repens]|nr:protein ZINC INDUCED FACILITATOR-LIKE [Trifolium repens]
MKEPLLEKKQYYKDCPGCKVEQEKELNQGVSIIKLLIIWMVVLSANGNDPLVIWSSAETSLIQLGKPAIVKVVANLVRLLAYYKGYILVFDDREEG